MRIAFLGNFHVPYTSESHHAATLERLGHDVDRLQEARTPAAEIYASAYSADVFVWVHTHGWRNPGIDRVLRSLKRLGIPTLTYHLDLWMGLRRQRDIRRTDPYWQLDHFFTADRLMAQWLSDNTDVHGHYLPAAVYDAECAILPPTTDRFDIAFVGSRSYHPEWPYRPKLIDWLADTYGDRFRHYGDSSRGVVRGPALNQLYADARVVVGDSLCMNYSYADYWSDRVYETLGRGGFLIHPAVPGMDRHFTDRKHLAFYRYGDFDQLRELIDYYLDHDGEREQLRQAGHELVRTHHTYLDRWTHILQVVAR
ncbi:glycosyltransferase family 1 protein [Nocardia otitidiscaviarum]|uniref:glycosyltransferase family protein n=1 Tax=Nocardia otitidiscaviarum TaxID=1823 RepID=UPI001893CE3B|nr:glycosyltransferase [Nocardia otitidiscaviarum]MBF6138129.1 glycosyltransferase family 1 protein [Nocardia otitidiscaviarum]